MLATKTKKNIEKDKDSKAIFLLIYIWFVHQALGNMDPKHQQTLFPMSIPPGPITLW